MIFTRLIFRSCFISQMNKGCIHVLRNHKRMGRWVRKWQFLIERNHKRGGWVSGSENPKSWLSNTWMVMDSPNEFKNNSFLKEFKSCLKPIWDRNSTTQKTLASKSKYIGTPRDASNARKSSIQQNVSCRSHKANTSGSFTFLIESVNFELGLEIVCDRNQVLVSGTETKVQFWYQYPSRFFFSKPKFFFVLH